MPTTDTTTRLLASLAVLRKAAWERYDAARVATAAALAVPTGKRGRRAAIDLALAEERAALGSFNEIRATIRLANQDKVQAMHDAVRDAARDHALLRPIFDAAQAKTRAGRTCVLDLTTHGVFAEVCADDYGLPRSVELRMLATLEERVEQGKRWQAKATTPEDKAEAEAVIANPEAHPWYIFGVSVDVSRHWSSEGWGINGSTWSVDNETDGERVAALLTTALQVRDAFARLAFPTRKQVEDTLEGEVG